MAAARCGLGGAANALACALVSTPVAVGACDAIMRRGRAAASGLVSPLDGIRARVLERRVFARSSSPSIPRRADSIAAAAVRARFSRANAEDAPGSSAATSFFEVSSRATSFFESSAATAFLSASSSYPPARLAYSTDSCTARAASSAARLAPFAHHRANAAALHPESVVSSAARFASTSPAKSATVTVVADSEGATAASIPPGRVE